nr:hypothetical protein [Tanacetum cinerariifolium]
MLDRTDFASWQQRIRIYYQGKENRVNILKSIDEGPYQMGTVRETLDESTEGAPQFEDLIENLTNTLALLIQSYRTFLPEINNQLRTSSNARNQATIQDGRVVVQNVQGRLNRGQGMNLQGGNAVGYGGASNRVGNVNPGPARPGQSRPVKCYNCNGTGHIDLTLNVDNVFQADDCNAFDFDVDEAPTAQTMFMANLSYVDPVTDEARPSYDLDILS